MVVVEVLSGDNNCGGIVVVINGVRWQWQKLGNDTQQRVLRGGGNGGWHQALETMPEDSQQSW